MIDTAPMHRAGSPGAPYVQGRNSCFLYTEDFMDMSELITAISTVGFPIVFCILIFWFLREETNNHKEEVMDLKTVISENNEILASLKQLIEDKLNG